MRRASLTYLPAGSWPCSAWTCSAWWTFSSETPAVLRPEGRHLCVAALANPIPIAPTLRDRTDLTVVVNASAPPAGEHATPLSGEAPDDDATGIYRQRIVKFITELTHRRKVKKEEMGLFDILSRSMDTMQDLIARFQLAAHSPDVVIEIPRDVCSVYEMYRARELIELGRGKGETMLVRPEEERMGRGV